MVDKKAHIPTKKKKEENPINDGHYFEAMDRCHCLQIIMETTVMEHPVIVKHKTLQKELLKAQMIIGGVYQKLGQFEETWSKPKKK